MSLFTIPNDLILQANGNLGTAERVSFTIEQFKNIKNNFSDYYALAMNLSMVSQQADGPEKPFVVFEKADNNYVLKYSDTMEYKHYVDAFFIEEGSDTSEIQPESSISNTPKIVLQIHGSAGTITSSIINSSSSTIDNRSSIANDSDNSSMILDEPTPGSKKRKINPEAERFLIDESIKKVLIAIAAYNAAPYTWQGMLKSDENPQFVICETYGTIEECVKVVMMAEKRGTCSDRIRRKVNIDFFYMVDKLPKGERKKYCATSSSTYYQFKDGRLSEKGMCS